MHESAGADAGEAVSIGIRQEPGTNVCHRFRLVSGDVEQGLADPDVVVVEETYTTPGAAHAPLEPHVSLAEWGERRADRLERHPDAVQRAHRPGRRLRPARGAHPGDRARRWAARSGPRRSCGSRPWWRRWRARPGGRCGALLERDEEFVTLNRHPATIRVRLGALPDGTLVAKELDCLVDTGAYADCGPGVATKLGYAGVGPYRIPHVRVDSRAIYTNLPPNGAYRGYGAMQSVFASERAMDLLAERLGLSPLELRRRNLLRDGDRFATGEVLHDVHFEECLQAAGRRRRLRAGTRAARAWR